MTELFVSMGEARRVHYHQREQIERLSAHNREMKEMLKVIIQQVMKNDPPVWYPKPGDVTRLMHLTGVFDDRKIQKEERRQKIPS